MGYFRASEADDPTTNQATHDTRGDASGEHRVRDFDAATEESIVFAGYIESYAGGGLTIDLYWSAETATSGDVKWSAAIERGNTDVDAASFATAGTATSTTNATSGIKTKTTITFADGAAMDSLGANEEYRIKIARVAADVADTMAGDAELHGIAVYET